MTFFCTNLEVADVNYRLGILLGYENLRQCTVLLRQVNNRLIAYRDLSDSASILAVSCQSAGQT